VNLFFAGVYIGIGLVVALAGAFYSVLGNSIGRLLLSPLLIVAWPVALVGVIVSRR